MLWCPVSFLLITTWNIIERECATWVAWSIACKDHSKDDSEEFFVNVRMEDDQSDGGTLPFSDPLYLKVTDLDRK